MKTHTDTQTNPNPNTHVKIPKLFALINPIIHKSTQMLHTSITSHK